MGNARATGASWLWVFHRRVWAVDGGVQKLIMTAQWESGVEIWREKGWFGSLESGRGGDDEIGNVGFLGFSVGFKPWIYCFVWCKK